MKGKYPEYPSHSISDIRDMFLKSVAEFPDRIALQHKKAGRWIPITYRELAGAVEQFACGLAAVGLKPVESKLAILGDNRPEWAVSYLAAACTGIVCVPIDRDLRETEVYHILYLSGVQGVVADARHIDMVQEIRKKLPHLRVLIDMDIDEAEAGDRIHGFEQVRRLGEERIRAGTNDYAVARITPDHLVSILFTSGTMGNSKGVMLTHGNIANNIEDAVKYVDLQTEDRFLSVLPLHHSYECTDGFLLALYRGSMVSYAENLRRIAENLAETHATAMLGVPLLWHALYKRIEAGMEEKGRWKVTAAKRLASFSEKALGKNIRRRLFGRGAREIRRLAAHPHLRRRRHRPGRGQRIPRVGHSVPAGLRPDGVGADHRLQPQQGVQGRRGRAADAERGGQDRGRRRGPRPRPQHHARLLQQPRGDARHARRRMAAHGRSRISRSGRVSPHPGTQKGRHRDPGRQESLSGRGGGGTAEVHLHLRVPRLGRQRRPPAR